MGKTSEQRKIDHLQSRVSRLEGQLEYPGLYGGTMLGTIKVHEATVSTVETAKRLGHDIVVTRDPVNTDELRIYAIKRGA